MRLPSMYRLRLATTAHKGIQSRLNDSSLRRKPANLSIWQQLNYKQKILTQLKSAKVTLRFASCPLPCGPHLFVHEGVKGSYPQTPVTRGGRTPRRQSRGNSCSAVKTTAGANRRDPQSSRDARRCPAGPGRAGPGRNETKGRAATGDRAAGWRGPAEPEPGSQLWPVLYLQAREPARRPGGKRRHTPGGDPGRPVPA